MTPAEIIARIDQAFATYFGSGGGGASLLGANPTGGKLYEAFVLAEVARNLVQQEGCRLVLSRGSRLVLKGSPGPINPQYPCIQVWKGSSHCADIWTDIEFATLSCLVRGITPSDPGHFHELDILMVTAGVTGYPSVTDIWFGVECKHREYQKGMLREVLGVRRELSFLAADRATRFDAWPRTLVPAEPPICLMVYSSSPTVKSYDAPGEVFGIDFEYFPMI